VLLLYTEPRLTPSIVSIDKVLPSTMQSRSRVPVHFYTEFLDLNMFDGGTPQRELRELLRRKYETRHIDLIVAAGRLAVPIALQNRANLFSNASVVFIAVDRSAAATLDLDAAATGTWMHQGWAETLDLATRLHRGMRRAVVVVGSTPAERFYVKAAREQLAASAGSIEVRYLIDLSFEDVLKEVAALSKDTVVLAGPFLRDRTGRDFLTPEAISRITVASKVPVYGITEASIGAGVVGGHVLSFEAHGRVVADLALRVLAGERPPPTAAGTTVPMFDDRQLKRWRIDRRLLPAGSVVLFHEPSVWERYREYIIGGVGLLLVQTGFIAALLVQRAQRRRAQRSLRARLQFETLLADLSRDLASCPVAAIDQGIEKGLRRIVEDLGTDRASLWTPIDGTVGGRITHSWARAGVPSLPAVVDEKHFPWSFNQIRQGRVVRLPLRDGMSDETSTDQQNLGRIGTRSTAIAPLVEGGAVVGGLSVGTVAEERRWPDELVPRLRLLADIFANALARQHAARAAAESAKDIRDLAGRLITAQEEERRRIARELHDGVNQDLAGLSIALSTIEDGLPESTPIGRRQELVRIQARAVELAEAIRHLSHELHPGVLQYAGLATALRSHCREFEREHGLPVTFHADDGLGTIPPDVALCLYRVTQEALKNAAKHAKASHVWVAVTRDRSDLVLTIRDDGRGFDLGEAQARGGLGLISLDERVRLAGGQLALDAKPQQGTEIHVRVPLRASEEPTARAD
jgi:signal transduction histidine kinase